ncbi:MAG: alpha/beta fold hydrolase [Ktedonobacterales bacterium]
MPRARVMTAPVLDFPFPALARTETDTEPHAQLAAFRLSHLPRHRFIRGVRWTYLASGTGPEALLMLPGAPGLSETAFQQIPAFEQRFRVIAPDLPAAMTTVADVVDGLASILDAEGIARTHVLGVSYSGMLAQGLVRRYPGRIDRMVLSHARLPGREEAARFRLAGKLLLALPLPALRLVIRPARLLLPREVREHRRFWKAYYDEIVDRLGRADYASRILLWLDACRQDWLATEDAPGRWSGEALLLEADNDPLIPPRERAALRVLHPRAHIHTFAGTKHSAWIMRQAEYLRVIEDFLRGETAG